MAEKPTRKNHVLRSKLTELHNWNMAVDSPETSTTTTPIVETEQLETDVSCFSPPACPEYQTTLMASKTNWSGNQSHLSTKKNKQTNARVEQNPGKNNKARNPNDLRDGKNMASAWSQSSRRA